MNDEEVIVMGHRNPDTDAICSAVAYAEFKRRTDMTNAIAARCGELVERVKFVLDYFRAPPPQLITDVAPRVRDVMERDLICLSTQETVRDALDRMSKHNIRILPVLDVDRSFKGFVSIFKMSQFLCPKPHENASLTTITVSIHNLARTLKAETVVGSDEEQEEELELLVGGTKVATFRYRISHLNPPQLLVVVDDQEDVLKEAILQGVRAIVALNGLSVPPDLQAQAREQNTTILSAPDDIANTIWLIRSATKIERMVHRQFQAFREDEPLAEAEINASASAFQAFPVVNSRRETTGIITKSDFLKRVKRSLILVDHNELSQAVEGADQVQILEIIDHHRLGIISTRQPILFRNEPVGSTSTIVADCFFRDRIEMTRSIAGLLLAGLVSDTLNLTSPTTTKKDAAILKKLEKAAGVNAAEFTEKLFASGSVLNSMEPDDAIVADCKEFEENEKKFSVAQIEEIGFEQFWKRKDQVVSALEAYRRERNYYFSALFITDVVRQNSLLLVTGSDAILRKIGYKTIKPGVFEMPGVVSRKKQLLPYLTDCFEKTTTKSQADPEPLTMV